MARLLSALVLLTAAGLTTAHLWREAFDDGLDYAAIYADSQRLEAVVRGRKCFVEIRDAALRSMGHGRLGLYEACLEVRAAADVFYPVYLEYIAQVHGDTDINARLARNLLDLLKMWVQDELVPAQTLPDLERELEDWLGD
jgi:hypothetical protein